MYRKDKLIQLGMYNVKFKHREEELRARLGSMYKIHNLGISLYRYRKHKSNKTRQLKNMENYKKKLFKEYDVLKKTKTAKNELLDFPVAIIPARIGSKKTKRKI